APQARPAGTARRSSPGARAHGGTHRVGRRRLDRPRQGADAAGLERAAGTHRMKDERTLEDRSLELKGKELESLIRLATERILHYIDSLPAQPSADNRDPAGLARSLREPMPESGEPPERLLDLLFE